MNRVLVTKRRGLLPEHEKLGYEMCILSPSVNKEQRNNWRSGAREEKDNDPDIHRRDFKTVV